MKNKLSEAYNDVTDYKERIYEYVYSSYSAA